jgi:hypothetical protein
MTVSFNNILSFEYRDDFLLLLLPIHIPTPAREEEEKEECCCRCFVGGVVDQALTRTTDTKTLSNEEEITATTATATKARSQEEAMLSTVIL